MHLHLRALASLASLAALVAPAPVSAAAPAPWQEDVQAFQIYDTQAARALTDRMEEHVAAERWSEALVDLQRLLEDHHGEVLGATRPRHDPAHRPSEYDVHPGAAAHATRRLFELDRAAHVLYRERFGERAREALELALESGDRAQLTRVARRWPITRAAERAWWAIGDLELEAGNVGDGLRAWGRALGHALGNPDFEPKTPLQWSGALSTLEDRFAGDGSRAGEIDGMRPRVDFALATLASDGSVPGFTRQPKVATALEPDVPIGRAIGRETDTWPRAFELDKNPFAKTAGRHRLFPARWEDVLFLSTSRDMYAVGAYTGELLWRTPESMLGWDDVQNSSDSHAFESAIDFYEAIIAPAAAQGIALAALQIPVAFEDKDSYGDLEIIRVIPERRIFAFDARTGKLLWDTRPPPFWDKESGTFGERMTVVGAPTIAGSRVLVPSARMRGRIEFHVGCYDLFDGELLWSAPLITGQRELNMFGRSVVEFSAPPVRVAGNRVIVQTQLGTMAALDLFTGETIWQTLYRQIKVTPGHYYAPGQLQSVWRNAPPVVVDETIVATPMDCEDLIALDLESGSLLWSVRHSNAADVVARNSYREIDVLLGADEHHVFLGGQKVACLESTAGISSAPPMRRKWVYPGYENLSSGVPRPVLTADRVYVPDRGELVTIDRSNGKRLSEGLTWAPGRGGGNLLLGEGMLFTLNSWTLSGYFEWQTMVDRARAQLRGAPDDVDRVQTLSVLLLKRGVSELVKGDYKRAKVHLENARRELERAIGGDDNEAHPTLRAALHEVLRAEARNLRLLADSSGALRRLRRARPLATTRVDLRDTMLQEQSILRGRDIDAWRTTVGQLIEDFGELEIICEMQPESSTRQPWRGELVPLVASLTETEGNELVRLPLGLWGLVERSQSLRGERGEAASRREFEDLHDIIAGYGGFEINEKPIDDWAAERIGEKVARGDAGYETFEDRARSLLEQAMGSRDVAVLQEVPRLYPHSRAAGISNDTRLAWSLDSGDAEVVVDIVLGELAEDWSPARATEREVRHLLRLAHVLGQGNPALRSGLVRSLARHHPDLRSDMPGHEGVMLRDLARFLAPRAESEGAWASATFDHNVTTKQPVTGTFSPLGEVPPDADGSGHVALFADEFRVYAFGASNGEASTDPLWRVYLGSDNFPPSYEGRFVATPGIAHFASRNRVFALARDTGDELWEWEAEEDNIAQIAESDGVVVVVENLGDRGSELHRMAGIDAVSGIELWSREVLGGRFKMRPIVGDGRVALLPAHTGRGDIYDIFTGRATASFSTGSRRTTLWNSQAAWIENGVLVLPFFRRGTQSDNEIMAFDLFGGEEAWRIPFGSSSGTERELSEIVTWAGRNYLVLWPVNAPPGARSGGIYELNTKLGSLSTTPVAELHSDWSPIGIASLRRTLLTSPYLFILCRPRVGDLHTVRAIHLPYGQRWEANLPRPFEWTQTSDMPLPALSDTTVAIAYKQRERTSTSRGTKTELVFFDRASGEHRETRTLSKNMTSTSVEVRFSVLGDALFISGAKQMELMR